MASCPNGHQVRTGAVFCGVCGIDLRIVCRNGHSNKPGTRFCETCGAPVASSSPEHNAEEGTPLLIAPESTLPSIPPEQLVSPQQYPDAAPLNDVDDVSDRATELTLGTVEVAPTLRPVTLDAWTVSQPPEAETIIAGDESPGPSTYTSGNGRGGSKKRWLVGLGAGLLVIVVAAIAIGLIAHHPSTAVIPTTSTSVQANVTTASQINWNSPTEIAPGTFLESVSCTSTSFCAAVDQSGNAFTFDGTSWSAAQSVDSGHWLISVSCTSTSFCAAVDQSGNAITFDGTSWSSAQAIDTSGLTSVSCASSSFCVAVDVGGNARIYDGTSWSFVSPVIDSATQLASVSCPSTSFCATVDQSGNVFTYDGSSWSTAQSIVPNIWLTSVSCSSSSFCVAVDLNGDALTYDGTSWSAVDSVDQGAELRSVSCASPSFCEAVDQNGNALTYDGSSWSSASPINSGVVMNSVSCPSASFCSSSDNGGDVVTSSTTTSTSTSTSSPSTTIVSGPSQATRLTSLLTSSVNDRSKLQNAVDTIHAADQSGTGCGANVGSALTNLRQVASSRQRLLNELSTTSMSAVPNGQLVLSDLTSAWLMSERIDKDFVKWASTESSNNCKISDSSVPSYMATETLDPKSTALKTTFVNLWNPIASQLNHTSTWTADQI